MPGLSALQKLNSDMLNLGDEVKIRSARGEKPVIVSIPQNVEDFDDSDDFKFGMPSLSEEEQAQADAAAAEREREANDFSDITGEDEQSDESSTENSKPIESAPDLSNLLDTEDLSFSDLDLSDFEDEPEEEEEEPVPEEIPIEDMDLASLLTPKNPVENQAPKTEQNLKPQKKAEPQNQKKSQQEQKKSDLDISQFEGLDPNIFKSQNLTDSNDSKTENPFEVPDPFAQNQNAPAENLNEAANQTGATENLLGKNPKDETQNNKSLIDSLNEDFENDDSQKAIDLNADIPLEFNEVPDFSSMELELENSASAEDFAKPADSARTENASQAEEFVPAEDFLQPEDLGQTENSRLSSEFAAPAEDATSPADAVPTEDSAQTVDATSTEDSVSAEDTMPPEEFDFGDTSGLDDDLPDFDTSSFDSDSLGDINVDDLINAQNAATTEDLMSAEDRTQTEDFAQPADAAQTEDAGQAGNFGQTENSLFTSEFSASTEDGTQPEDFSQAADSMQPEDFASTEDFAQPADSMSAEDFSQAEKPDGTEDLPDNFFDEPGGSVPSPDDDVSEETFDTSDIDGLNFENSQSSSSFDSNLDSDDDDFFTIPGFSDTQTADFSEKKPKPNVQSPDFSQGIKAPEDETKKQKNTFTDAEYERFKKNLNSYPLNVKIALEDLIVKNELTDDALFEILEKVLRKVPARTLASELEKLTDKNLEVPRDFERRSAEEYEAYKKSLEYKLKNKIIPGALMISGAAIMIFCIFFLVNTFIVKPSIAEHLYKQGYALIDEEMYPQSEERFDRALTYKPKKKWFYRYAENYQNHKQFDRARMMYRGILQRYNHEKAAGLKWAKMESDDLFNYEEAERLLKREVLDYHINDSEAILQLGDLYLDWATEKDSSKYPQAKEQYDFLISLYGANDTYLSRQMRYFIRTDNLAQVLKYKEIFYPRKKSLGSQDLTELSGFLLDKRYGKLNVAEESLRFYIEDLRSLLERALTADTSNPVAHYNMARYFVETNNTNAAIYYLKNAVNFFDSQTVRNKRDTYKFINSYRLLGEQYIEQKEYLLAEENYGKGINLFETENASSGFESTEQVGHLYADLADLDYFVAADNDVALTNYINAVENKYDNSSVRYKIGYIQYQKQNYPAALGSFIKSHDSNPNDMNLNLALANTLSLSNDSYVAKAYYENLIERLDSEREKNRILYSGQVTSSQREIIDMYMKVSNNLGVTLSRLANQTGNSAMNAQAIVYLQESLRSWDALTRNPETMIRLNGSNLAEQNIKYIINPVSTYKPEIYTEIKRTLYGEKEIE